MRSSPLIGKGETVEPCLEFRARKIPGDHARPRVWWPAPSLATSVYYTLDIEPRQFRCLGSAVVCIRLSGHA